MYSAFVDAALIRVFVARMKIEIPVNFKYRHT